MDDLIRRLNSTAIREVAGRDFGAHPGYLRRVEVDDTGELGSQKDLPSSGVDYTNPDHCGSALERDDGSRISAPVDHPVRQAIDLAEAALAEAQVHQPGSSSAATGLVSSSHGGFRPCPCVTCFSQASSSAVADPAVAGTSTPAAGAQGGQDDDVVTVSVTTAGGRPARSSRTRTVKRIQEAIGLSKKRTSPKKPAPKKLATGGKQPRDPPPPPLFSLFSTPTTVAPAVHEPPSPALSQEPAAKRRQHGGESSHSSEDAASVMEVDPFCPGGPRPTAGARPSVPIQPVSIFSSPVPGEARTRMSAVSYLNWRPSPWVMVN